MIFRRAFSCILVSLLATQALHAQFSGAVYTATNGLDVNEIVAFGRNADGTLSHIGDFSTGGAGSTEFDGGEGLDPLISADSIIVTDDQRHLLAVNAGSDTISSFSINPDFTLDLVSTVASGGVGPNSLAYNNGRVFVSNIDRDGFALGDPGVVRGEPNDEGNITGFSINSAGILTPLANSTINLDNRPADLGFSADGSNLIVSSITAGSAALPGANAANSIAVYGIGANGAAGGLLGSAINTPVGNPEGRNLSSAIDFDTTVINDREFIVVTEAREFNSLGAPPALPALQSGSVSVYELLGDGSLNATELDFALGDPLGSPFDPANQLTACWIDFGADGTTFYVSNAINSSISSFSLNDDGSLSLIETIAAQGTSGFENGGTTGPDVFGTTDGFIDLDVSDDGQFLYQLEGLSGEIGVYSVDANSAALTLLQNVSGYLPEIDTQGIVSVTAVPEPTSLGLLLTSGLYLIGISRRRRRQ